MSPHETLFRLEATQHVERVVVDHTPLCHFAIWDFAGDYYGSGSSTNSTSAMIENQGMTSLQAGEEIPSNMFRHPTTYGGTTNNSDISHPQHKLRTDNNLGPPITSTNGNIENVNVNANDGDSCIFGSTTVLIFVIDAQDEPYDHVLQSFTETVARAIQANPHITIEVFINKVDGELFLSDEAKFDCRRDVMQQVSDELSDAGISPDSVPISYHLTSIYDHSVFEAFSRVVQKLIPQLPTLENLLNVLVSTCSMEKAYLFDVASKLYISTDSTPVDMQSVELCSDMIDVVLDVSGIYGLGGCENESPNNHAVLDGDAADTGSLNSDINTTRVAESMVDDGEASNAIGGDIQSHSTNDDNPLIGNDTDGDDKILGTIISQGGAGVMDEELVKEKEIDTDSAYDSESSSIIRLRNGMVSHFTLEFFLVWLCAS